MNKKADEKYAQEYANFFQEFHTKGGVPEKDLSFSKILGYVDTYQTIDFNGNVYPHLPFTLSDESLKLIEPFRAKGFYEGYFGD